MLSFASDESQNASRSRDRGALARKQLIAHATRIFAAKDSTATSTREIRRTAGAYIAAIQSCCGDKEGLYREDRERPIGSIGAQFGGFGCVPRRRAVASRPS